MTTNTTIHNATQTRTPRTPRTGTPRITRKANDAALRHALDYIDTLTDQGLFGELRTTPTGPPTRSRSGTKTET